MKVKVTNNMVSVLRKAFPDYKIRMDRMLPDTYKMIVDYDLFRNEQDFSFNTGKFSAIAIVYPDNHYAPTKYLTTNDLLRCFRWSDKTFDGFLKQVKQEIEI